MVNLVEQQQAVTAAIEEADDPFTSILGAIALSTGGINDLAVLFERLEKSAPEQLGATCDQSPQRCDRR